MRVRRPVKMAFSRSPPAEATGAWRLSEANRRRAITLRFAALPAPTASTGRSSGSRGPACCAAVGCREAAPCGVCRTPRRWCSWRSWRRWWSLACSRYRLGGPGAFQIAHQLVFKPVRWRPARRPTRLDRRRRATADLGPRHRSQIDAGGRRQVPWKKITVVVKQRLDQRHADAHLADAGGGARDCHQADHARDRAHAGTLFQNRPGGQPVGDLAGLRGLPSRARPCRGKRIPHAR